MLVIKDEEPGSLVKSSPYFCKITGTSMEKKKAFFTFKKSIFPSKTNRTVVKSPWETGACYRKNETQLGLVSRCSQVPLT